MIVTLPPTARRIRAAVLTAHAAADDQDAAAFAAATVELAALDAEQVRLVLGTAVAGMLETRLPEGLSSDDLQLVAERTLQRGAWFPGTDVPVLIVVLTQALGVLPDQPPDGVPHLAVVRHAVLLVTELAAAPAVLLVDHLDAAFTEIARAETQEQP